jgi:hypothetical protein
MPQSISSALPSHPPSSDGGNFRTDNLELASFLLARQHRLIGAVPSGRLVVFEFEPSAEADVANFFSGSSPLPPITLFEHHRTLRSLIATVRNSARTVLGGGR